MPASFVEAQNPGTLVEEPSFTEYLTWWDSRLRFDHASRDSAFRTWKRSNELVRNTGKGYRHGNLCSEFVRTLGLRMFEIDPTVRVTPQDPDYKNKANNAAIIASSVAQVADLKEQLFEAATAATWASHGWMEVGHPSDPWCLDVMRSNRSPGLHPSTVVGEQGTGMDRWEEVPAPADPSGVQAFNPFEAVPDTSSPFEEDPEPLFAADFGTPYLTAVDPRLVITPPNVKELAQCDYVARLRWLTVKELEHLVNYHYPGVPAVKNEFRDLFAETEGDSIARYPTMLLVVQLYIIRDRNNPEYNGWTFCYPIGEPEKLIYKGPRKDGGMIPLIMLKLNRIKKLYDTTLAEELARYADIFDIGVKAMFRDINRMMNKKWKAPAQAGLDATNEKNLTDDNFTGVINASDPRSLDELVERRLDQSLFQGLNWVKGLAQSASGASDIDMGRAVKDISARQTQALMEATGINVEGMKSQIAKAAREAVMKLMHLVGIYNHLGDRQKYQFGNKFTVMNREMHDYTSSLLYIVEIADSKIEVTNEERMLWTQLLKLVDSSPLFQPLVNPQTLLETTFRKYGEGPENLASHTPVPPPMGQPVPPEMGGQPAIPGNVIPFGGSARNDAVYGQHPERELGSRGIDLSNAMQGMARVGTGMGE